MAPLYYCPFCGRRDAAQAGQVCPACLEAAKPRRDSEEIGTQYLQAFAICTGFSIAMRDQANSMTGSDPVRRKLISIWRKIDELRVHLIDHPAVLKARDLGDEG